MRALRHQASQAVGDDGETDASIVHMLNSGCPTVVVGVTVRHAHSHASMMRMGDVKDTVRQLVEVVKRLDRKTVEGFSSI